MCQVAEDEQRVKLEESAIKNQWTCQELAEHVRPFNAALKLISDSSSANKAAAQVLTPKQGSVGLYRIIARDDGLAIDVLERVQNSQLLNLNVIADLESHRD